LKVCLGLTEPDAGTNTFGIRTFAKRQGDEYVINGSKMFITGIEDAGLMILVARTVKPEDAVKKSEGITLFAVDLPDRAIHHTPIPKHGYGYLKTCELGIDELRVPAEGLLGEEGKGWYHILDTLNPERIITACGAVGTGAIAIAKASEYASQRQVFDNYIGAYQGVQFPLAAAYAKLECAWLATLKAADLYDKNEPSKVVGDVSNIAKYTAVEAAIEAGHHAMLTLGGYGYAREYHIERWCRELQSLRIAPITQHLTLAYIGQHILGMPKSYSAKFHRRIPSHRPRSDIFRHYSPNPWQI
jgi:acyl-CoA dehydrogenase